MNDVIERSERVEIEDRWLAAPLMSVVCGAIMFLVLIVWVVSGLADSYGVPFGFILIVAIFGSSAQLTSLVSILTYYKDSRALKRANGSWVPIWWLYGISTFFTGPFTALIYLVKRMRNTSVNWSQLRAEFRIN